MRSRVSAGTGNRSCALLGAIPAERCSDAKQSMAVSHAYFVYAHLPSVTGRRAGSERPVECLPGAEAEQSRAEIAGHGSFDRSICVSSPTRRAGAEVAGIETVMYGLKHNLQQQLRGPCPNDRV